MSLAYLLNSLTHKCAHTHTHTHTLSSLPANISQPLGRKIDGIKLLLSRFFIRIYRRCYTKSFPAPLPSINHAFSFFFRKKKKLSTTLYSLSLSLSLSHTHTHTHLPAQAHTHTHTHTFVPKYTQVHQCTTHAHTPHRLYAQMYTHIDFVIWL